MRTVLLLLLIGLVLSNVARAREPVIGGRCEGCDAVFIEMPDEIPAESRLCPADEPGEPMLIEGTVANAAGDPVAGVVIYAYQTDERGVYPPVEALSGTSAYRHGRLRGWAKTDAQGRYKFLSVRPASYPGTTVEAHVHMHVIEVDCCTYYIDNIHFRDDPHHREAGSKSPRGGSGLVDPQRSDDGVWTVTRDIQLGLHVPGYGS